MELVARAQAGDREAWAEIWDLYGGALHAYARRLVSDPHDADDIVADTFVSAAEHLSELRDPEALRPWLYAICRRHVQRRWQGRDRIRPMEQGTLVRVVDGQEHDVSANGLDAAEATELLWSAAEGLGSADRELLALVLNADLDSGDVAVITGEAASAVYVKVSRLKDGLGRAAGALLVARHHREDCAELDLVLHEWNGAYSTLWRKRIARHIDGCETCDGSRAKAAGALFGIAGLAPLLVLPALKQRCLDGVGSPELVPVSFDAGWPVAQSWEPERRRLAMPVLAALSLVALLWAGLALQDDKPTPRTTAAVATGVPVSPSAAREAPRSATPSPSTAPTRESPRPKPTTAPPVVTTPKPPALPTLQLTLSETELMTACGSPTTTVASVEATGQGARTVVRWGGTASGSRAFDGSGETTIGPYASVTDPSGTDTVTVTATVTDSLGRATSVTRTFTVTVAPC